MHILDDRALDLLAEIEGEEWKRDQLREDRMYWPYHFYHAYKAVHEASGLQAEGKYAESSVREVAGCIADTLVIYGAGGWNRYTIDEQGFLIPIYNSFSSNEKYQQALKLLGV